MRTRTGISVLAALTGLTQRAIRFYEERGLIAPTRDGRNQRCYGVSCRERLLLIAKLRGLGLGLADIQAVLEEEAEGPEAVRRLARLKLAAVKTRLERRCASIEAALAELAATPAAPNSVCQPRLAPIRIISATAGAALAIAAATAAGAQSISPVEVTAAPTQISVNVSGKKASAVRVEPMRTSRVVCGNATKVAYISALDREWREDATFDDALSQYHAVRRDAAAGQMVQALLTVRPASGKFGAATGK